MSAPTLNSTLPSPVLVTGALGFIGQRLVNRLIAESYEVIAFDLPGIPLPDHWQGKVNYFAGDISNPESVEQAVQLAGQIFHLAAVVGDWGGEELHHRVTVEGTRLLFDTALKHQCPLVMTTSIVVYGDKIDQGVCAEDIELGKTFGPYSRCKHKQEELAKEYASKGLDIAVVRPANVYGAGSKPWVDELSKVLLSGKPALIDGGNKNAGLVHVENVVELLMLVAKYPERNGEIFNICDEEPVSWASYCTSLASFVGAPPPKSLPLWLANGAATLMEKVWGLLSVEQRPSLTLESLNLVRSDHNISIEKAKCLLGYRPVVSYQEGLEEVRQYLKHVGNK